MSDKTSCSQRAFSLVEVILAIGIFALVIVAIIGLLGPINSQVRKLRESQIAQGLAAPIREELNRMRFSSFVNPDFTATASDWINDVINPETDRPSSAGGSQRVLASLVGRRDGSAVKNVAQAGSQIPRDDQFYLVQVLEPAVGSSAISRDLSFHPGDAHMVFEVEVSWPFRVSGGAEVPYASRDKISFHTAIVAGEPL